MAEAHEASVNCSVLHRVNWTRQDRKWAQTSEVRLIGWTNTPPELYLMNFRTCNVSRRTNVIKATIINSRGTGNTNKLSLAPSIISAHHRHPRKQNHPPGYCTFWILYVWRSATLVPGHHTPNYQTRSKKNEREEKREKRGITGIREGVGEW